MSKKALWIFLLAVVVVISGWYFVAGKNGINSLDQNKASADQAAASAYLPDNTNQLTPTQPTPVTQPVINPAAPLKEFTVTGSNYSYDLKQIKVKLGDHVRVTFKNADGFHDWRIDELGVATNKIQGGQQQTVDFMASQKGTFQYYCSVGQHRANGMWGNLIVE